MEKKKLNYIWNEIRQIPKSFSETIKSMTDNQDKHAEKLIKRDAKRDDILKEIRDKGFDGLTKDQITEVVKEHISNRTLTVSGQFYPKSQKVEGAVDLKAADIDRIAAGVSKAIVDGIKIPEAKEVDFPDIQTVQQAAPVEIFGKVANATMPANEYLSTRISNGDNFIDLEELLTDIKDAIKDVKPVTQVMGGGSINLPSIVATDSEVYAEVVTVVGDLIYYAEASAGTAPSTAAWRSRRIDKSAGATTTWADGNDNFDNVATDLTALSYS